MQLYLSFLDFAHVHLIQTIQSNKFKDDNMYRCTQVTKEDINNEYIIYIIVLFK